MLTGLEAAEAEFARNANGEVSTNALTRLSQWLFDLESEGKQLSLTDLQGLHAAKTGALIGAVLVGDLADRGKIAAEIREGSSKK